jgi:hypothetical protein
MVPHTAKENVSRKFSMNGITCMYPLSCVYKAAWVNLERRAGLLELLTVRLTDMSR